MDEATLLGAQVAHRAALTKFNDLSKIEGVDQLELLRAEAEVAAWGWPLAGIAVERAHEKLAQALSRLVTTQKTIDELRLVLDAELRRQQVARDHLTDVRGRVSDLSNQRLTEAAIDASRTTARATIALVIVTAVLILATLVPALTQKAEPAALPAAPTPTATR